MDLLDLVHQLRGDRVGLLAFRGRPLLLCPLTTDYGFLSQSLDGAGVDSAPAGETDIGDAIEVALQTFEGDEGAHRAIVLISDGEDLAGKADAAAAKAQELAAGEKKKIESVLAGLKMVLNSSDRETIQKWTQALSDTTRHLAEVMMNRSVKAALSGKNIDTL